MQSKLEMAAKQQQESASEAALSSSDSHAQRIETSVSNTEALQLTADPQETTVRTVDKVNHNQGSGPTDSPCATEVSENIENKQALTMLGSQGALSQRLIKTEREVR